MNYRKIIILNDYLATKGGGERSTFQFAFFFLKQFPSAQIDIITREDSPPDLPEILKYFELPATDRIRISMFPFHSLRIKFIRKILIKIWLYKRIFTSDLFLNHSHDPAILPLAKININLIMFPFNAYYGRRPIRYLNIWMTKLIFPFYVINLTNSEFTKSECLRVYGSKFKFEVIYPYFDFKNTSEARLKEDEKKKFKILNISRFTINGHAKNQDLLLNSFLELVKVGKNYEFEAVFIGSLNKNSNDDLKFFLELYEIASRRKDIRLIPNASYNDLLREISSSDFFWLGTGFFRENIKPFPIHFEHFGIVLIEAISQGLVPLAPNRGGPVEILADFKDNLLVEKPEDLVAKTLNLVKEPEQLETLKKGLLEKINTYSRDTFELRMEKILESI